MLALIADPRKAIAWTCVAVSFCFIAFRVYVRFRVFNRLFDDDALVILSWFIVLTTAILWHVQQSLSLLYVSYGVAFGGVTPPPYFLSHFTSWLRITFAQTFLNFCALWCIKLSFLAFFRKLGHHVRGQKVLWFVVLGVTIAGWAVSVGVIYYPCTFMTLEKAPGRYSLPVNPSETDLGRLRQTSSWSSDSQELSDPNRSRFHHRFPK